MALRRTLGRPLGYILGFNSLVEAGRAMRRRLERAVGIALNRRRRSRESAPGGRGRPIRDAGQPLTPLRRAAAGV